VVEPGKVRVRGNVKAEENRAEAENVLRGVKGVEAVESEIQVVPPLGYGM